MTLPNSIHRSLRTCYPRHFDNTLDFQTHRLKSIGKQILADRDSRTGRKMKSTEEEVLLLHLDNNNKLRQEANLLNNNNHKRKPKDYDSGIGNYLSIMKRKNNKGKMMFNNNNNIKREEFPFPFQFATNLTLNTKRKDAKFFTFSSKQQNNANRRRTTLESLYEKIAEKIEVRKIHGILNNVISNYKCLESFGLPAKKINEIVINRCQEKKDLHYIFLKNRRNKIGELECQYRKNVEELESRLKSLLLTKKEELIENVMNDVEEFNHLLSEDTLEKGKLKVIDVQKSIHQKQHDIALQQHKLGYESIPQKNFETKELSLKISNIMEGLRQQQQRNGLYRNISRINRKMYEIILETQHEVVSSNQQLLRDEQIQMLHNSPKPYQLNTLLF